MGARPMARLIQDTIRSALADELLFGRLSGRRVTIDVDDDGKVQLVFEEIAEVTVSPVRLTRMTAAAESRPAVFATE